MIKTKPKKSLVQAPAEKCFWVCNGQILKNLRELAEALEKMAAHIFKYHVNGQKNDFAKWVADVLREDKLAKNIRRSMSAKTMARKIKACL